MLIPEAAEEETPAPPDGLQPGEGNAEALAGEQASHAPLPPSSPLRRAVPANLVRQVAKRLRAGRPVLLETDFGPVVLASSLDAARRGEEKRPGVPVFLPYEWRALLDCETPDEIELLIAVKRSLGARLLPEPPAEEGTAR